MKKILNEVNHRPNWSYKAVMASLAAMGHPKVMRTVQDKISANDPIVILGALGDPKNKTIHTLLSKPEIHGDPNIKGLYNKGTDEITLRDDVADAVAKRIDDHLANNTFIHELQHRGLMVIANLSKRHSELRSALPNELFSKFKDAWFTELDQQVQFPPNFYGPAPEIVVRVLDLDHVLIQAVLDKNPGMVDMFPYEIHALLTATGNEDMLDIGIPALRKYFQNMYNQIGRGAEQWMIRAGRADAADFIKNPPKPIRRPKDKNSTRGNTPSKRELMNLIDTNIENFKNPKYKSILKELKKIINLLEESKLGEKINVPKPIIKAIDAVDIGTDLKKYANLISSGKGIPILMAVGTALDLARKLATTDEEFVKKIQGAKVQAKARGKNIRFKHDADLIGPLNILNDISKLITGDKLQGDYVVTPKGELKYSPSAEEKNTAVALLTGDEASGDLKFQGTGGLY